MAADEMLEISVIDVDRRCIGSAKKISRDDLSAMLTEAGNFGILHLDTRFGTFEKFVPLSRVAEVRVERRYRDE